jgi:hypothetical protein
MSAEKDMYQYKPGLYVVVLYESDWFVAQMQDKEQEQEADRDKNYVFLNFMKKNHTGDSLQWPRMTDRLNILQEDILLGCDPLIPGAGTSSNRAPTFSLSNSKLMIRLKKAYYLTKTFLLHFPVFWFQFGPDISPISSLKYSNQYHTIPVPFEVCFRCMVVL